MKLRIVALLAVAAASYLGVYAMAPNAPPAIAKNMMRTPPPQTAPAKHETILPGVETHGCHATFRERFDLAAASGGPLRLESISCSALTGVSSSHGVPSPDGERLVRWSSDRGHAIQVAGSTGGQLLEFPNRITFQNFGAGLYGALPESLAWARDSEALWTVRQDVVHPSGFSLGGLQPIRLTLDGTVRALPALSGPGRLDAIQWVGADGLALAQFSTRGNYYRPEQIDAEPTLAIADMTRGRVRDRVRIKTLAPLRQRAEVGAFRVVGATATVLPDGRVHAVVEISPWGQRPAGTPAGADFRPIIHPPMLLVWTEGDAPRLRRLDSPSRPATPMMLSPDGSRLLRLRPLESQNLGQCRRIPCQTIAPPPVPVEGDFAELVDPASGRSLWRLQGQVSGPWGNRAAPAISPDGQLALLDLPPDDRREWIGLVRIRDGRVLHRFSVTQVGSYPKGFGFSPDGRRVWVTVAGSLYRYRLAV